ncbi:SPOR domain-containing protein [Paenirhodobacter sp.]|uniref:SPOR domain-containing protein n=1 Tax=Paenirhodobacter sp. TaxID=1965326 RepID=UPI003B3FBD25
MVSTQGRDDGYGYEPETPHGFAEPVSRWVQYAGAATSIALILGVVIWGYKLAVRDVSGVPVIRAIEGPARIAPEDPGGDLARHVGLAVNEVAGKGLAAPGPERVVLAPAPEGLSQDDAPMSGVKSLVRVNRNEPEALAEAEPASAPVPVVPQGTALAVEAEALPVDGPEESEGAAAAQIRAAAAEANRTRPVPRVVPEIPKGAGSTVTTLSDAVPDDAPGVKQSPRPVMRPARAPIAKVKPVETPVAAAQVEEVDPATLPEGARVVQIGAFDTPDLARAEWNRVAAKFGAQMSDKRRIIQEAVSGGRTFYRLRAEGFRNVDDSRKFCAALVEGGINCIPTVAR